MADDKKQQNPLKSVGAGLDAPKHNPADPQQYLAGSNHPYAPFVGNALKWESFVYDDGTSYEGLMREMVPHGKGVLVMGEGYGGGIQNSNRGDKYEGEFQAGFAHGLGLYISPESNEVYRGEWSAGKRQGCGVLTNMSPFYKLVEAGVEPGEAWEQAQPQVEAGARWGTWHGDYFVSAPDDSGKFCGEAEIKGVLQELDSVVTKARMFQHKPDGDVTISFAQDAEGKPLDLMQDPLHYPHGTKFLAPGPMGQCFPVPDDPTLRAHLAKVARNHARIYNSYNFDPVTAPGSEMEKAEKLWKKLVAKLQKEKKRLEAQEKKRLKRAEGGGKGSDEGGAADAPAAAKDEGGEGDELDDEDLIAAVDEDAAAAQRAAQGGLPAAGPRRSGPGGFAGGSAFGSVSLGLSRSMCVVGNVMAAAAQRADRRRTLTRPTPRK